MAQTKKKTKKKAYKKTYKTAGAPTLYREEYCDSIIEFGKQGFTVSELCCEIGIHKDTFYEWVKQHSKFSDSFKKYKGFKEAWHQKLFRKMAIGDLKEGNLGAAIWLSKIACGWTEERLNEGDGFQQDKIDGMDFF